MTKKEAQAFIALCSLQAINHPPQCDCKKTAEGVADKHYGKSESDFNAIMAIAEG